MKKLNNKGINNLICIIGMVALVLVTIFGIIVHNAAHSSNNKLQNIETNSTLTKDYLQD